jgi:hypothetical protein
VLHNLRASGLAFHVSPVLVLFTLTEPKPELKPPSKPLTADTRPGVLHVHHHDSTEFNIEYYDTDISGNCVLAPAFGTAIPEATTLMVKA